MKEITIAPTREEAIRLGLSRYASETPCVNGHVAPRYTLTRNCSKCAQDRVLAARARDKIRMLEARAQREVAP